MEVLLYSSAPCQVRLQFVEQKTCSKQSVARKHHFAGFTGNCSCRLFGISTNTYSRPNSVVPLRVTNESLIDAVVGGKEGLKDLSDTHKTIPKVIIPGLPHDLDGESSANIRSCFREYKPKLSVHYEKAGCDNVKSPAVLFLPGFGVGSFHYEKQLKDLGREYRVWALDFLGQGKSLPLEDPAPLSQEISMSGYLDGTWGFGDQPEPWAEELVFSIDLWRDQVRYFIEEVIGEPVYVVGNSLGGYVAAYFAASDPHLVKGITLLNATPFWGFLPNRTNSPLLARMFPWAGTFPLPANVRRVMEIVWQKISEPETIADVLQQVYADRSTNVDKVFSEIIEVTQHPAAAAALASIMCAPAGELSFNESLVRCRENNVDICLMYGKEDPWVRPIWGKKVKWQFPEVPYYEISPAGHCPHDEVPEVVNYLLRGWIKNVESQGSIALPLLDDAEAVDYDVIKDLEFVREGSKKSVRVSFFGSQFSLWNQVQSQVKAGIQNLALKLQLV